MPAGLGGGGSVGIAFETAMGTYAAPTVYVPILNETLKYTEAKYYSEQIRQQSIVTDVKSGYYHVEGDIQLEVDPANIVYWLYASRHIITKTGPTPFTYKFVPGNQASADIVSGPTGTKSLSITIVRNNVVFGYTGCVVGNFEFMVEDGVLKATMSVLGLKEAAQADPTEVFTAANLFGADSHSVYLATPAAVPTFGAVDTGFNGFTFRANYNATAQNRIIAERSASYISYAITECEIESELDFLTRADYDLMVTNQQKAIRFESLNGGATLATAATGIRLQANRVSYDVYDIALEGMGDLIMAGFTGKAIGIGGGDAFEIHAKTAVDIL